MTTLRDRARLAHLRYKGGVDMLLNALDINMSNYASAIVTTNEIIDSIAALESWE